MMNLNLHIGNMIKQEYECQRHKGYVCIIDKAGRHIAIAAIKR